MNFSCTAIISRMSLSSLSIAALLATCMTMVLRAGAPKALFRPGSSTVVLLFQRDRVRFAHDLVENQRRGEVQSRFSLTLGEPLTETDVAVRSLLALPAGE